MSYPSKPKTSRRLFGLEPKSSDRAHWDMIESPIDNSRESSKLTRLQGDNLLQKILFLCGSRKDLEGNYRIEKPQTTRWRGLGNIAAVVGGGIALTLLTAHSVNQESDSEIKQLDPIQCTVNGLDEIVERIPEFTPNKIDAIAQANTCLMEFEYTTVEDVHHTADQALIILNNRP